MHYIFMDETYRDMDDFKRTVVAAWTVDQQALNEDTQALRKLREFGEASTLERIDAAFKSLKPGRWLPAETSRGHSAGPER
jgi:hypothetical protein